MVILRVNRVRGSTISLSRRLPIFPGRSTKDTIGKSPGTRQSHPFNQRQFNVLPRTRGSKCGYRFQIVADSTFSKSWSRGMICLLSKGVNQMEKATGTVLLATPAPINSTRSGHLALCSLN